MDCYFSEKLHVNTPAQHQTIPLMATNKCTDAATVLVPCALNRFWRSGSQRCNVFPVCQPQIRRKLASSNTLTEFIVLRGSML